MAEQAPKKELSMEMRLLLAFLLMGAVMFVSQLWLKPPESPQPARKDETPAKAAEQPGAATPAPATTAEAPPAKAAAAAPNPGATPAVPQPNFVIDTQHFRVV